MKTPALDSYESKITLAKKLLTELTNSDGHWFFEPHPEYEWNDMEAFYTWECWLRKALSKDEFELYMEAYGFQFLSMGEMRNAILNDAGKNICA